MGILAADGGTVRVLGADPQTDRGLLARVGYLPEERGLYPKMRVLEQLVFFARLKRLDARTARTRAEAWLERLGLSSYRGARTNTLSKGMQQKVQFIATVLHEPELLVLDEPFSGLDPMNQEVIRDAIAEARRGGRTVLLSTHVTEHAEQLCDRVAIVARGRKVLDGTVEEVRRDAEARYVVELAHPSAGVRAALEASGAFERVVESGARLDVRLADSGDPRRALAALAALEVPVVRFERVRPTLREVFMARVGPLEQKDAEVASAG
jgi:ABC-2 type transport system ATP-binding protein